MNILSPHPSNDASTVTPPQTPMPAPPAVEIVIPVYNEERVLDASVRTLRDFLRREFTFAFQITVADNASTDATLQVAKTLSQELPEVGVLHLDRKGRGRALRTAWGRSEADVVAIWMSICPPTYRRSRIS